MESLHRNIQYIDTVCTATASLCSEQCLQWETRLVQPLPLLLEAVHHYWLQRQQG